MVGYTRLNLKKLISTPLKSTGFPPNFGATCDKSTTLRATNHAAMMSVVVDGTRNAIPMGAPKVYAPNQGVHGHFADRQFADRTVSH